MQVALHARVSTPNQQQEGTIASQVRSLKLHIQQRGWGVPPAHEFLDEGVSGARLDRPALDRELAEPVLASAVEHSGTRAGGVRRTV